MPRKHLTSKVGQINYVSRNQFHSTANLNFGLMCKKAKHCWALSTNFSVQLIVFLWSRFASWWIGAKIQIKYFKIAVWWSDSWNGTSGDFSLYHFFMNYLIMLSSNLPRPSLKSSAEKQSKSFDKPSILCSAWSEPSSAEM